MSAIRGTLIAPDGFILVEDNEEAKSFLAQTGKLGVLIPVRVANCTFSRLIYETQAFWVLALLDFDHPEEKDNGYTLFLFPKHRFTYERFMMMSRELIDKKREANSPTYFMRAPLPVNN